MKKLVAYLATICGVFAIAAVGFSIDRRVFIRYPVGLPVPVEVYTEPFDPCDPAYKFLQPPPKDWAEKFGYNERTALIHAISELRVVVAAQGKRLLALEDWQKKQPVWVRLPDKDGYARFGLGFDPNASCDLSYPLKDPNTESRVRRSDDS